MPVPGTERELSDGWRAAIADDHLRRAYADPGFDDAAWEALAVPGHWRSSPAFAEADGPLLHRHRFDAAAPPPGRRAWLTFDGLFYQGDVWLDGGYLGDTEGYFAPHTFEVTEALRARPEHLLAVEVTCPPRGPARRALTGAFQDAGPDAYLDPAWNPGGIWRPVRLTETGPVRIAALRVVCREADPQRAVLAVRALLDSDVARQVRLRTEVGALDHEIAQPLAAGSNEVTWTVTIERPALWWPRALGDPVLHDVRVSVVLLDEGTAGDDVSTDLGAEPGSTGDRPAATADEPGGTGDRPGSTVDGPRSTGDQAGSTGGEAARDGGGDRGTVSDERRLRTGLRSVRLRRWIASVNGERLFLKGATLGPTRMALAEATPADVRRDVELATDAGLDLLRVHAHVGPPALYDAADRAGLLLWQDLPLQGTHARGIRAQAVRQAGAMVDLLGHHPSILMWCGHDDPAARPAPEREGSEPAAAPSPARAAARQQLPSWNRSVLDASVKRALHRADGSRPVIAHSGVAPHLPQLDGTDSHLALGWHTGDERDLPILARRLPRLVRFPTRFGAQAVPSGAGAAFARPERWPDLDWNELEARHALQRTVFEDRVPPDGYATFAGWRDATQRYQAELLRHHVEELRRLKYRPTGGFAMFLFADGAPAISASVLDHDRRPKAGYAALAAACRPVIVVADRLPATLAPAQPLALDVHVVSDLRAPVDGARVAARLSWPGGEHRWSWTGDVPADACVRVGTIQALAPDLGPAPAGALALDLELTLPGGEVVTRHDECPLP